MNHASRHFYPLMGICAVLISCLLWNKANEVQAQAVTLVESGELTKGCKYYKDIFPELGIPRPSFNPCRDVIPDHTLKQMLAYLGYSEDESLGPLNLQNDASAQLMERASDDILASRFFAPKITDVSVTPINVGWRKLVRLKARDDSDAKQNGLASGFLLFNIFQGTDDPLLDPYRPRNESLNTQLILVRDDTTEGGRRLRYPIYFFVYGKLSQGGPLITFLSASFDARAPGIPTEGKYYVPDACAECHGGLKGFPREPDYAHLKLNFLDTDHWLDRVQPGDDFNFIDTTRFGVLYDGGTDSSSEQFQRAFAVLRKLNQKIKSQNEKVEEQGENQPSFQLRAVKKWLEIHENDVSHKDYFARALPSGTGDLWQANAAPDKDLLPLLNRYCYRCHSSLRYNIYERPRVIQLKSKILRYLDVEDVTSKFRMPQDRVLEESTKSQIKDLIGQLPDG